MADPLLEMQRFDGPARARPTLIAHGLFGSGRNWGAIAKRLSATRPVITVDMRNHGGSFWSPDHSYADLAQDLARLIDHLGHGPLDVIGHSMGGKAAMMLALTAPDRVARLMVGDIAPVSYGHSQMEFIDAMRAVDLTQISRRSDAADQLGAQGVEPALQSFFTQSLDVGEKRWRMNLDALAAEMPKILAFPETDAQFAGRTLFLSGGNSEYVLPDHRATIKSLFPSARFAKLPGAGHWLHAEKPREFVAAAETFLSKTPPLDPSP